MVELLDHFARHQLSMGGNDTALGIDTGPPFDFMDIYPLIQQASSDPEGFTQTMRSVATEPPTWAMYGASAMVFEALSTEATQGPESAAVVDGGIDFLRTYGVPPLYVPGFMWTRFIEAGGTIQTWLPVIPVPQPGTVPLTPLAPGESRLVAVLTSAPDSNRILVRTEGDRVAQVVDARYSDDDPTRTQWVNEQAPTLHEIFAKIARSAQIPTHWYLPELEPFFPLPRPRLPD